MQSESSNFPRPTGRPPLRGTEHRFQCPHCISTDTKFCYYKEYSLSQPRYFCKSCRRYWTHDGALHRIPAPPQRPQKLLLLPLTPPVPLASYPPQRVPADLTLGASGSFTDLLNSHGSGFPGLGIDFGSDLQVVGARQVAIDEEEDVELGGRGLIWPDLAVSAPEGIKTTGLDQGEPSDPKSPGQN